MADITGQGASISALENPDTVVMVQTGVPDAQVMSFDTPANAILALDSGRSEAVVSDLSTAQYVTKQSPEKYKVAIDSWWPQTYAFAVKPGDQRWLNWVNTALHELLVGVDYAYYQAAFLEHFGVQLNPPAAGFPVEYK